MWKVLNLVQTLTVRSISIPSIFSLSMTSAWHSSELSVVVSPYQRVSSSLWMSRTYSLYR